MTALLAVLLVAATRAAAAERVNPVGRRPAGVVQQAGRTPTVVLRVATDASYWPMEYISGTQVVGYDIDLMNAIGSRLGVTVDYANVPWNEIFGGLVAGQYDAIISTVSVTPDRDELVDFSLPYMTLGANDNIAIAVRQGDDALRRQLNEALRALRAAGTLDAMIAGVAADVPQWQPHLPAWPYVYLPFVIRN